MKIVKTLVTALLLCTPAVSWGLPDEIPSAGPQQEVSAPTHFLLCLSNGEQLAFVLDHNPKIVHGQSCISVIDEDLTLEYQPEDIHKYLLGTYTPPTGIDEIAADRNEGQGRLNYSAGDVLLSGFEAHLPVRIVDLNGIAVYQGETDANGALTVRLSEYPAGVYLIQVQHKTFKLIKR